MQNSQLSNPTVAKLLEADADLAAQEAELNAQLVSVQVESTSSTQPSVVQDVNSPELNGASVDTTPEAPTAPIPQKQKAKKDSSLASSKQNQKSAPAKKQSKAPDTWQQYVKDELYGATLSEAVSEVMQQHSEEVLEIAAIVDAIFTGNIPKEVRSTARERVSNVLSVGAKSGKWYRGQLGKYSMSNAAVSG